MGKTKGAALLGAGIGLKVLGAATNNPGLQQAGGAIAAVGAVKKVGAHFIQPTYNSGGTRQKLKTKGAALLGAGIGLKVLGGATNNPGLQQLGGTIAAVGAVK